MHPEKEYLEHLQAGRFMLQHSPSTGRHVHYPRVAAPGSGATDLVWVEACGMGTVHSTTTIRQKPPTPDYNLALIDLAEGPRMMARVDGMASEAVKIGMKVKAKIVRENDQPLVVFEPVDDVGPPPASVKASSAPFIGRTQSQERFSRAGSAIVATATYGCGDAPGYSSMELAHRAGVMALAEAGLQPKDVDGLFTCITDDALSGLTLAETLGIHPRFLDNNRTGGSSFQVHAMLAAMALEAGLCEVALIAYGSNQRSAAGKLVQASRPSPWEAPYRPVRPISSYALAAARHMHRYGTTKEQLGEVAIAARRWAQLNPEAFVREPLTMDDYLKARKVADPFNVRDCCLVTDGAAAVVMTRADRARDLCSRPAYLLGGAQNTTHREIASMADLSVTALAEAAPRAYAQAGVRPKDIDVVELYDAFTINTVLFLEDLGFCSKGEGGAFVEGGRIAPGGVLAVNTNGGGLSCVHPGMYGLFTMVEAARQLMGMCGARQVPDAKLAIAQGNGGELSHQALLVLGTDATI